MTTNTRMYWIQTITPLHVGAGKGVGFIDMPIMREKVTTWPLIPGSAVKGVSRDYFREQGTDEQKKNITLAFGNDLGDKEPITGALILTDAHIVSLPIRSIYGTFAYITSPLVLERLARDMKSAGCENILPVPAVKDERALVSTTSVVSQDNMVYCEDLDFSAIGSEEVSQWATTIAKYLFPTNESWKRIFVDRFVILSDNCFNFLAETGTDVTAHIKIDDDSKIVVKGGLWYEECLPPETILAGLVWCDRVFSPDKDNKVTQADILKWYTEGLPLNLQIGGKATVGKGQISCTFTRG